ncbi:MAG: NfeD family protein [Planctomycetota bacterium]
MPDTFVLFIMFSLGAATLIAEFFIPSHGILTMVALTLLGIAVYMTFEQHGREAGVSSLVVCAVAIPTLFYLAVKHWRQTAIGRKVAPPNPTITNEDTSVPVQEINDMIGRVGTSVSPLRPVGICEFDGHRLSCISKFGVIEAGVEVEGVGIEGANLTVTPKVDKQNKAGSVEG